MKNDTDAPEVLDWSQKWKQCVGSYYEQAIKPTLINISGATSSDQFHHLVRGLFMSDIENMCSYVLNNLEVTMKQYEEIKIIWQVLHTESRETWPTELRESVAGCEKESSTALREEYEAEMSKKLLGLLLDDLSTI